MGHFWGATIIPISLKIMGNKNIFEARLNFFLFYVINPLIFAKNRFSKIPYFNSDRDGFMCPYWAKMSKFIPLSLRLSGIEFCLVSDYGESNSA